MLVQFVSRTAKVADAEDDQLAQFGVEQALVEIGVDERHEGHEGRAAACQHFENIELRQAFEQCAIGRCQFVGRGVFETRHVLKPFCRKD